MKTLNFSNCGYIMGKIDDLVLPTGTQTLDLSDCEANNGSVMRFAGNISKLKLPDGIVSVRLTSRDMTGNIDELVLPEGMKKLKIGCSMIGGKVDEVVLPSTMESLDILEYVPFAGCRRITGNIGAIRLPDGMHTLILARCTQIRGAVTALVLPRGMKAVSLTGCRRITGDLSKLVLPEGMDSLNLFGTDREHQLITGELSASERTKVQRYDNPDGVRGGRGDYRAAPIDGGFYQWSPLVLGQTIICKGCAFRNVPDKQGSTRSKCVRCGKSICIPGTVKPEPAGDDDEAKSGVQVGGEREEEEMGWAGAKTHWLGDHQAHGGSARSARGDGSKPPRAKSPIPQGEGGQGGAAGAPAGAPARESLLLYTKEVIPTVMRKENRQQEEMREAMAAELGMSLDQGDPKMRKARPHTWAGGSAEASAMSRAGGSARGSAGGSAGGSARGSARGSAGGSGGGSPLLSGYERQRQRRVDDAPFQCHACTFVNYSGPVCEMCGTSRHDTAYQAAAEAKFGPPGE
jgi:hypothetical protein